MGRETVLGMDLSASPMGESDKRLVILTREKGKISAFARGASKPNSPLLGCGQAFVFGEFSLYIGKSSYSVNSVRVINYFSEFRNDLATLYHGYYFCEVADYYSRENLDAKEMLKLLYQTLKALVKGSIQKELVRYIYEWKQMVINGEAPVVANCVACGSTDGLDVFSIRRHGMLCRECSPAPGRKGDVAILGSTLYTLQFITNNPVRTLYTFKVAERVLHEMGKCISAYMQVQINHEFRSLKQFESLKLLGDGGEETALVRDGIEE